MCLWCVLTVGVVCCAGSALRCAAQRMRTAARDCESLAPSHRKELGQPCPMVLWYTTGCQCQWLGAAAGANAVWWRCSVLLARVMPRRLLPARSHALARGGTRSSPRRTAVLPTCGNYHPLTPPRCGCPRAAAGGHDICAPAAATTTSLQPSCVARPACCLRPVSDFGATKLTTTTVTNHAATTAHAVPPSSPCH